MKDREFIRPVTVSYIEPTGELWEIAKGIPEVFKWHHYYTHYERHLPAYRDRPIKLLEIGVRFGGSLKLFKQYLHPDSAVVGIDIEDRCRIYERNDTPVEIGDQGDEEFLASVVEKHGPFDVIIDDGSHLSHHQRGSWQYLFREGLNDGGLYIVEDVFCSYFTTMTEEGEPPFIATMKMLIDLMHMSYMLEGGVVPFESDDPDGLETTMEYYEAWVNSIEVVDGMVFMRKQLRSMPVSERLKRDD